MRWLRLFWRTLGGLWSVLMMLIMAASLALNVAMAVVPAVAAAVAGAIEAVSDVTTIRKREAGRTAALEARATRAEGRVAAAAAELDAERAARRAATAEARAARQVTYRGAKATAGEAVADTSDRLARRVATASARNVGSTFAEALPVVGVGVIAAATAWELHDACEMMKEVRALDVALNPDRAVQPEAAQVCGMQAPGRDEIWAAITASPARAWDSAQALYDGLPDLSLGRFFEASLGMFRATYDWAFGAPAGPLAPGGDPLPNPSGWSPLGWLSGEPG